MDITVNYGTDELIFEVEVSPSHDRSADPYVDDCKLVAINDNEVTRSQVDVYWQGMSVADVANIDRIIIVAVMNYKYDPT